MYEEERCLWIVKQLYNADKVKGRGANFDTTKKGHKF